MTSAIRRLRLLRARWLHAAAVLAIVLIAGSGPLPAQLTPPAVQAQGTGMTAAASLARLPLSFVENRGQMPGDAIFYARAAQADLLFTPSAFVARLRPGAVGAPPSELRVQMAGARADATPISLERAEGVVNIFAGNDPARWLTGIHTHARIGYTAPWPGIDVWYDGRDGRLESTYAVSAGADLALVRLRYSGHDDLSLGPDGGLLVRTRAGLVSESAPVIYQEIGARRVSVDGRFDIVDNDTVGFAVAAYDHRYPLLIDPVYTYASLAYSTYFGGTGSDQANAIAVDASGNAYIAGYTTSTGPAPLPASNNGGRDAFVIKLNPIGTSPLVYATYFGGLDVDEAEGIAVNAGGEAYVTGSTASANFPTATPFQALNAGGAATLDAFVTRLNTTGAITYSTYLGGGGDDMGRGIAVSAGKVLMTGTTLSADYPLSNPPIPNALLGLSDAFVTKLDPALNVLTYSQYLGGSLLEDGRAIAVDGAGNVYVTGSTKVPNPNISLPPANNFPLVPIAMVPIGPVGVEDVFVAKIGSTGTRIYSTYFGGGKTGGGTGVDGGYGIAVDSANGYTYVTGLTHSTNFPLTGSIVQPTYGGGDDAFVTKLNATGTALLYSTYLGGSGGDAGAAIAVNTAGEAFITGSTFSANFPYWNGFQPVHGGTNPPTTADAFITRINAAGSAFVYSSYLGGGATDRGWGIAVNAGSSDAYVAGSTLSSPFNTRNPLTGFETNHGQGDAFAAKVSLATTTVGGVSSAPDPAALPVRATDHAGASANPIALAILAGASLAAFSGMAYAKRRRA